MGIKNVEIAKILGISKTAVSLAINNKPGVSEETRKRVLELIHEDAQKTVDQARQPVHKESYGSDKILLLSVHKTNGDIINDKPFFSTILEEAQQEAMRNQCTLVITHFLPGQNIEEYMRYLEAQNFDGLIIEATEITRPELEYYKKLCRTKGVPMILMDGSFDLEEIDAVELDNEKAVFRAVDYAVSMGHRDIGYLASRTEIMNFVHSHDGFRKGIHTFHLEHADHPVIKLPASIDGAYAEMKQFLENMPEDFKMPTLFIADLDFIALGAMKAMQEKGYKIPENVSFIGYDDVISAELAVPPLTTTRVNRMDIGRITVKHLLQKMEHPGDYYTTTQVSSTLVIRESVKKLNQMEEQNHERDENNCMLRRF